MNSRSFTDGAGAEWRVRATMPTDRAGAALPEAFSRGWLVFESPAGAVKRLAPVPEGWDRVPETTLARWCDAAVPARERGEGMTGEMRRYEAGARRDAGA
jgi:hypothetical protein